MENLQDTYQTMLDQYGVDPKEGLTPNYPGLNTTRSYWDTTFTKMFCKATGEDVKPAKPSANGYFRHTREKDIAKQIVHFDPTPGQSAIVCWIEDLIK